MIVVAPKIPFPIAKTSDLHVFMKPWLQAPESAARKQNGTEALWSMPEHLEDIRP